jgi:hypothetical protein
MIEKRLTVFGRTSPGRKCVNTLKTLGETQVVRLKWRPSRTAQMVRIIYEPPHLSTLIVESLDKLTAKAQKIMIKLPWELTTIYSEVLRQSGHQSDDEEDEDDIEAHEASIQRLKVGYF